MNNIVEDTLIEFTGGWPFFHAMDDKIKYNPIILNALLKSPLVKDDSVLVLSGEFGREMIKYMVDSGDEHAFVYFEGSPRRFEEVKCTGAPLVEDHRYIMLDDTYQSGKTFWYIQGFLWGRYGIKLDLMLVAYDGATYKREQVKSIYRYYDHHDSRGNKKK